MLSLVGAGLAAPPAVDYEAPGDREDVADTDERAAKLHTEMRWHKGCHWRPAYVIECR